MILSNFYFIALSTASMLVMPGLAISKDGAPIQVARDKCEGRETAGEDGPAPADPYPLMAAGWGMEVGNGLMYSRWAEDWTGMRAAGRAPSLKAIPLVGEASLTLSAEGRLRYDAYENKILDPEKSYKQGNFRGIVGADLRLNPNVRVYSEVGSGHVESHRSEVSANFQNKASLQQLFIDTRTQVDSKLIGAMVGRQEFTDGPKQLLSLSDGPNLHRTWNGGRFYLHDQKFRLGAFDLRATRQQREAFDEQIDYSERLQGINASFIVSAAGPNTYFEPFWFHSVNPVFRMGGETGLDRRDTLGARIWGRLDKARFDWTVAHQTGDFMDRDIDSWALFAIHSVSLSNENWNPRVTARVDIASGGGTYGTQTIHAFNPLYVSSNYIGEGQFLSLSNLVMVTPGLAISPAPRTNISFDYGTARRLKEGDAVYAGGMRAYTGTQNISGQVIGSLFRFIASWSLDDEHSVFFNYEYFKVGEILKQAGFPPGRYGYVGTTFRY